MTTLTTRAIDAQEVIKRAREETERKTGKTPEQLYQEREKRISDVIQLKVPDRVPISLGFAHYPLKYAGLPQAATFYDPAGYQKALIDCLVEYQPDCFAGKSHDTSGVALALLGKQQLVWPGGALQEDEEDQFLDTDLMKEDEYDLFITDPSDYILRYYLPRAFGALAPLANLPPIQSLVRYSNVVHQSARYFTNRDVINVWEVFYEVGQAQAKYDEEDKKFGDFGRKLGFPALTSAGGLSMGEGAVGCPPFDLFANHLRGMRGAMIDMFKQPDKLLTACDRVLEWQLARAVPPKPEEKGKRRVGYGANHFMSEEFLSRKQFERFVWPTWKKAILAMTNQGFIVRVGQEGKNDNRLELFLELPKGKAFISSEKIADWARMKAILGGQMCFMGSVPASLLWGGSPQEVEEYCRDLIKVCGKGGGFILKTATGMGDAKPANIKAMVDAVDKYGRY